MSGFDSEQLRHLFVQEPFTGTVRLYPFAINHKLRDRTLAHMSNHLVRSAGRIFYVDFLIRNFVRFEKLLCRTAIAAPRRRIQNQVHASSLA